MSPWFLYIAAILNIGTAVQFWYVGRWGMAAAFLAYATANLGIAWDAR